jgi:hypothetical protein
MDPRDPRYRDYATRIRATTATRNTRRVLPPEDEPYLEPQPWDETAVRPEPDEDYDPRYDERTAALSR